MTPLCPTHEAAFLPLVRQKTPIFVRSIIYLPIPSGTVKLCTIALSFSKVLLIWFWQHRRAIKMAAQLDFNEKLAHEDPFFFPTSSFLSGKCPSRGAQV